MEVTNTITGNVYIAQLHTLEYQPPVAIVNFAALSREVLLNGDRTPFYFGSVQNETRVNFRFAGLWHHITNGEHQPANLYDELSNLRNEFYFVTFGY